MNRHTIEQKLDHIAYMAKKYREQSKLSSLSEEDTLSYNGKAYRVYTQNDASRHLGISNRKLVSMCTDMGITAPQVGTKWGLTLPQIYTLCERLGFHAFQRSEQQSMLTITVNNLKGGSGKTTCCATLGAGLAIETKQGYRILMIDGDTQTNMLTDYFVAHSEEPNITVSDLMKLAADDACDTQTLQQAAQQAIQKTHIPNLDVLPGGFQDKLFETWIQKQHGKSGISDAYGLLKRVLDAVKDQYDICIIDTSPSINFLLYNAMAVADLMLVPVKAEQNDQHVTCEYLVNLREMYAVLKEYGHGNWQDVKLLVTDIDNTSNVNVRIKSNLMLVFPHDTIRETLPHSTAIERCSELFSTIYDVNGADFEGSRKSLQLAQAQCFNLVMEINDLLHRMWHAQDSSTEMTLRNIHV